MSTPVDLDRVDMSYPSLEEADEADRRSPPPNGSALASIIHVAESMARCGQYSRAVFDALMVAVRAACNDHEYEVEQVEDRIVVLLPDHPPPDHDALGAIILEAQAMAQAGRYMYKDYQALVDKARAACNRHRDVAREMDARLRALLPRGG